MITVLVIDPDPAIRLLAKRVLMPAGITVIAVTDVAAGLRRLAALRADLIICDIEEPTHKGRSAAAAIAEFDPSVQILGAFPKHQNSAGMSPEIGNALGKPFTPSELLTKVRRLCSDIGRRRGWASARTR